MQSAPCTNASVSMICAIFCISKRGVSRAKITREKPHSLANFAPFSLHTPACVLKCKTICGYASFTAFPSKMSCNMTASTPADQTRESVCRNVSVSFSFTSVFMATYTFAPHKWAYSTVFDKLSLSKFSALCRAEKAEYPK